MMYTVELNFADPSRADEWNAWYETYLRKLITLPGLSTAQRFRAAEMGALPNSAQHRAQVPKELGETTVACC